MGEIEADFHAGVAAADDEDFLISICLPGLVLAGVDNLTAEVLDAVDLGDEALGVLPGRDDEPPADVFHLGRSSNPPEAAGGVVFRGLDLFVKVGTEVEAAGVGVEIVDELLPGRVFRKIFGEGDFG